MAKRKRAAYVLQYRKQPQVRARRIAKRLEREAKDMESIAIALDEKGECEASRCMMEAFTVFRAEVMVYVNSSVGALPSRRIREELEYE